MLKYPNTNHQSEPVNQVLHEEQPEIVQRIPVAVLPVVHDPLPPVRQAETSGNDELLELQNSLRTFRLSNDGLSLLLERTQAQLVASNARVTETERLLQVQTQQNAILVQIQDELNGRVQVLTAEREAKKMMCLVSSTKPVQPFILRPKNL